MKRSLPQEHDHRQLLTTSEARASRVLGVVYPQFGNCEGEKRSLSSQESELCDCLSFGKFRLLLTKGAA